MSRLNASSGVNKKTGPAIVLKVMKGDQVQLSTYAFYNSATQSPGGGPNLLNDLLNALSTGVVGSSGGHQTNVTGVSSTISPGVLQFFSGQPYNSSQPKAYLNWILFDEQMQYVSTGSSAQQVSSAAFSGKELLSTLQNISRSGYLYVYVSNESPQDVYFDDLSVKHYTGPLVQEQSYYPFGLEMQGLSSKAFNKLTSQYKFNGGVELEEELNIYSTFYRQYDQQIGRFTGVDILSEKSRSAYGFGNNNPAMFNDPLGDLATYEDQQGNHWHSPGVLHGTSQAWGEYDWVTETVSFDFGEGPDGMGGTYSAGGGGGGFGDSWQKVFDRIESLERNGFDVSGFKFGTNGRGDYGIRISFTCPDASNMMVNIGTSFVIMPEFTAQIKEVEKVSGVEISRTIMEGGLLSWHLTRNGVSAAQVLANGMSNTSYIVHDLGELKAFKLPNVGPVTLEQLSKATEVINVALVVYDISDKGLNWSNGTDAVYALVAFTPGGWAVSGLYFITNGIVKEVTGRSIGDFLHDQMPILQMGLNLGTPIIPFFH